MLNAIKERIKSNIFYYLKVILMLIVFLILCEVEIIILLHLLQFLK